MRCAKAAARRLSLLTIAVCACALIAAASAATAAPAGSAVVLVSGFNTGSAFTVPDPSCAGAGGHEWSSPAGPAAALRAAGFNVFTAPVKQAGNAVPPPCTAGGPAPPVATTYIDSNGDVSENGRSLGSLLAFLRDRYGVTDVHLVGHSDGGLWSRAAISQDAGYAGVRVSSLTTLGTPHTGAFPADLAEYMHNGQCQEPNRVEQLTCELLAGVVDTVVKDLGEATVEELSSAYVATWNREQVIGACPVTGIAGTRVSLPFPGFLLSDYYNPSDGLVGQASALARASSSVSGTAIPSAGIPGFRSGGSFRVVHGSFLSSISAANLLNTQAVSGAVVRALSAVAPGASACSAPAALGSGRPPGAGQPDGVARVRVPMSQADAVRGERLPPTRRGDVIVTNAGTRLLCGRAELRTSTLLSRRLRLALPGRCRAGLGVRGRRARVMVIRKRGDVSIRIAGGRISVRVRAGQGVRRIAAHLRVGGRFRRVRLDRRGRGTIARRRGRTGVRVIAVARSGRRYVATAVVSR